MLLVAQASRVDHQLMDCLDRVVISLGFLTTDDENVDLVLGIVVAVRRVFADVHGFDLLDSVRDLRVQRILGSFVPSLLD